MQAITKEQFEDILFDSTKQVVEKRTFKRSSIPGTKQATIKLMCGGKVLALREISPKGNFYYLNN